MRPDLSRRSRLLLLIPLLLGGLMLAYGLGAMSSAPALAVASGSPMTFPDLVQQIDAGSVVAVIPATWNVPGTTGTAGGQVPESGSASAAGAGSTSAGDGGSGSTNSGSGATAAQAGRSGAAVAHAATSGTQAAAGLSGGGASDSTAPSSSIVAAAQLTSGRIVPVESAAGPAAVIDALRLLGRASVIGPDAAHRWPAPGGAFDLGSLLPILGIVVTMLLVAFVGGFSVARRRRGPAPDRWTVRGLNGATPAWPATAATAPAANPVRFADVAGVEEVKLELTETVEFLKDPARFRALGAKPVRGVLLSGPPGTGKTLLAKAVAHEAGVPFFAASGSEFVERYVGVGAERVRSLFAKARETGRGVVFIDEIDAVAKVRGGPNSHDEREQTLNQLLVEMDGFSTGDTVVVMAATNRVDTLDPALLRPGRFTRKIHVPLPDREAREAILRVHASDKPLATGVDLAAIARRTYGFSGAMLADLLNEAAIFAARARRREVLPDDVHRGWLKVAVGTARQRSMDERERSIIAAHESGHAICSVVAGDGRRVEEISLFQHGEALGVTVSSGDDDALPSEVRLRARLIALMGGRAAEDLVFGEVTGGASNDFEQATRLATQMVTRWGLGRDPEAIDPGPTGRGLLSAFVVTGEETPLPAELVTAQARAIRELLDDAYAEASALLRSERERLDRVAAYLFDNERMSGDELSALMDGSLAAAGTERWRELTGREIDEEAAIAAGDSRVARRGESRLRVRPGALQGAGAAIAAAGAASGASIGGAAGGTSGMAGMGPAGARATRAVPRDVRADRPEDVEPGPVSGPRSRRSGFSRRGVAARSAGYVDRPVDSPMGRHGDDEGTGRRPRLVLRRRLGGPVAALAMAMLRATGRAPGDATAPPARTRSRAPGAAPPAALSDNAE
jgi:cell division protease FtsH